jgi:hypothetical protein
MLSNQTLGQNVISADVKGTNVYTLQSNSLNGTDTNAVLRKYDVNTWAELSSYPIINSPVPPRFAIIFPNGMFMLVHTYTKQVVSQRVVHDGAMISLFDSNLKLMGFRTFPDIHVLRRPLFYEGDLIFLIHQINRFGPDHSSLVRLNMGEYMANDSTWYFPNQKALYFEVGCYSSGENFAISDLYTVIFYDWLPEAYSQPATWFYVVISSISLCIATLGLILFPFLSPRSLSCACCSKCCKRCCCDRCCKSKDAFPVSLAVPSIPKTLTTRLGVAFSGGGVRSGSFMVGVLRYLCKPPEGETVTLFQKIDCLSTVSGGDYAGSGYFTFLKEKGYDPTEDENEKGKKITSAFEDFEENFQSNSNYLFGTFISLLITISSIVIGPILHLVKEFVVAILFGKFLVSNLAMFDHLDRSIYPIMPLGFGGFGNQTRYFEG